jgi:hypothetical protein
MTSICAKEIESRWPKTSTLLMNFLIELDRRGLVKSEMKQHMDHGFERIWESR